MEDEKKQQIEFKAIPSDMLLTRNFNYTPKTIRIRRKISLTTSTQTKYNHERKAKTPSVN